MEKRATTLGENQETQSNVSNERTSMSAWVSAMTAATSELSVFAAAMLTEEASKHDRLRKMSETLGLPVYDRYIFQLPMDEGKCADCVRNITESGFWNVALRVSSPSTRLLLRELNVDLDRFTELRETIRKFPKAVVELTPYREPDRSGSLLIDGHRAILEMVEGPHFWITKFAVDHRDLMSCSFRFPFTSIRYSVDDPLRRSLLYRTFKYVTGLLAGSRVRDVCIESTGLYAEFHWHAGLGYKFIECSYDPVWTATRC